ncbi:MAG: hypothetical protein OXQ89_02575 [Rhodospirillaceae bacterium]|nr:hypothetical protein [Rhodospirillaceae bacterium]MDD9996611.1 hypothetical protein [Rhodospirillaceae bacterium]MDE0362984.1 hypothetical protein [Rhodospirillaceae bacterium]
MTRDAARFSVGFVSRLGAGMAARLCVGDCPGRLATFAALAVVLPGAAAQDYVVPRTPDGQPDLQGIWQAVNTAVWNIQDHSAEYGVPAGQGVVVGNHLPYQPWALEQRQQNYENRHSLDTEANCKMVGVPRITYMPYPFQIIQTPDQIVMIYEWVHTIRNIFMTGERLEGSIQWYMGDSRGHWDGDTLVVDVMHFTDETWFDRSGNFHSDALHVVERYTPAGPDHLMYEVTITDPEVFIEPWQMRMPLYRRQEDDIRILEYECYALAEDAIQQ